MQFCPASGLNISLRSNIGALLVESDACNLSLLQKYITCFCKACNAGFFIHRPQTPLVKNAYHSPNYAITLQKKAK
jgi:hypothetical protein